MRSLFVISIIFNLIFICYIGKKLYRAYDSKKITALKYFLNRDRYLNSFLITSNDIVFAGDSETELFILDETFNDSYIKNRGILYDTSIGLLNRIDSIVKGKPKKIFIEIGVNDLINNIPPEKINSNILAMIKKIKSKSPNTVIYIQSILPSNFIVNSIPIMMAIEISNGELKSTCDEEKVLYIDLFSLFVNKNKLNSDYDSGDGLHLNAAGYRTWGNTVRKYLN